MVQKPIKIRLSLSFFCTTVIIETINEKLNARIVSKVGDHILTSNNKIIKLKDIKSIKTLN